MALKHIFKDLFPWLVNQPFELRYRDAVETVYAVVENGDPYLVAYKTDADAVAVVKAKYKEEIEEELRWLEEAGDGHRGCNDVDVPEAASGLSRLYIEKGINIEIHKLPIK